MKKFKFKHETIHYSNMKQSMIQTRVSWGKKVMKPATLHVIFRNLDHFEDSVKIAKA